MSGIDWPNVAVGFIAAFALWTVLPRGVVLVREHPVIVGNTPLPDTWRLRNDSPLPAKVMSVTVTSPFTMEPEAANGPWGRPVERVAVRLRRFGEPSGRSSRLRRWIWNASFRLERFALRPVTLPVEGGHGVQLTFDDEVLEIGRTDLELPWRGIVIPPGEVLTARVSNNVTLTVRYRRGGLGGVFERRTQVIHGYA